MATNPPKEKDSDNLLERTEKKAIETLTVLWHEIPHWLQDNHYIISGYRAPSNSYKKSFASVGNLHNETVNIWTHLLGAAMAATTASIMYISIRPRFEMANAQDVLVFACYFLGAFLCLGMSATYHTISNHSEAVQKLGNRLDYIGIVVLIWGSFIPAIYYGFSLEPKLIRLYWSMITTIGAGTLVIVLYPKFRTPDWRPVRALMFVLMGLSAVVPVIHGLQMYGYEQLEQQMGLSWLVGQGVLYITGAAIYAVSDMGFPARKICINDTTGSSSRTVAAWHLRHLRELAPDLSCACCHGCLCTFRWAAEGVRLLA